MDYNAAYVKDICEIFVSVRDLREWTTECMLLIEFYCDRPRCHTNEI